MKSMLKYLYTREREVKCLQRGEKKGMVKISHIVRKPD